MKARRSIAFLLVLLMSAGVWAGGGKERGDVGQGNVNQGQVRVIEPPAQWTASSTPTTQAPDTPRATLPETQLDTLDTLLLLLEHL